MDAEPRAPGWPAALAALRAAGAEQAEPVRWRFLEALARRTVATGGRARALLDARLDTLVADLATRLDARAAAAATGSPAWPAPTARSALVAPPARSAAAALAMPPARPRNPAPGPLARLATALDGDRPGPATGELQASRLFGHGWARLAAEAQLQRAQAALPPQAGPLNSERLVLAALQRLQVLSPDHLARLMAEVQALRWLARAEAAAPGDRAATASSGPRGPRRGAHATPRRPGGRR